MLFIIIKSLLSKLMIDLDDVVKKSYSSLQCRIVVARY